MMMLNILNEVMKLTITAPRGTKDILPAQIDNWIYIENKIRNICKLYGYEEIRTPIFEHTELFQRGIGEGTDVVDKEMYTFEDRGGRSITLRPENTASAVRAYLQNKLFADKSLVKLFYIGSMFRYDRPQAGRLREFHQFGIEALGEKNPAIDAEVILLAVDFLQSLGLKDLNLKINTVGCPKCRPVYRQKLQHFFKHVLKKIHCVYLTAKLTAAKILCQKCLKLKTVFVTSAENILMSYKNF